MLVWKVFRARIIRWVAWKSRLGGRTAGPCQRRSPDKFSVFLLFQICSPAVWCGNLDGFLRLTYSYIGIYLWVMARAATTSDAFNAVAEPRRREILEHLAAAEMPVGDLVVRMGLEQPSVSKHLKVLRDVGLVRVRRNGRHMMYRTNAEAIRPLSEWTKMFERLWAHQLLRIKERAEEKEETERAGKGIGGRLSGR